MPALPAPHAQSEPSPPRSPRPPPQAIEMATAAERVIQNVRTPIASASHFPPSPHPAPAAPRRPPAPPPERSAPDLHPANRHPPVAGSSTRMDAAAGSAPPTAPVHSRTARDKRVGRNKLHPPAKASPDLPTRSAIQRPTSRHDAIPQSEQQSAHHPPRCAQPRRHRLP